MSKAKNEKYISKFLLQMTEDINNGNKSEFLNKFYDLKEVYFNEITPTILKMYKDILKISIESFITDSSKNTMLSAVISLSNNLVPSDEFDVELYDLFQICLEQNDSRTKANTIIALGEYDPQSPLFKAHFDSKSNRVAADAMLVDGKNRYTEDIHKRIEHFLFSPNPFFVSSGVFLVSELATYYYSNKMYDDFNGISQFFERIQKYAEHPHEMVRKRALQAIQGFQSLRRSA